MSLKMRVKPNGSAWGQCGSSISHLSATFVLADLIAAGLEIDDLVFEAMAVRRFPAGKTIARRPKSLDRTRSDAQAISDSGKSTALDRALFRLQNARTANRNVCMRKS